MIGTKAFSIDNVCSTIVAQDLCVGCGVCAGVCPVENLRMSMNQAGQYQPVNSDDCREGCSRCLDVCPFQDRETNEDTLGAEAFRTASVQHTTETGYYLGCYAGYAAAAEQRVRGASGGMTRWLLTSLLERSIVDAVICVVPNDDPERLFRYAVLTDPDAVQSAAKSSYYPVELSAVLQHVIQHDARYAIVGLPCFLKSIRLAMSDDRKLRERIPFLVGLTCGQMKSRGFAEYLIRHLGFEPAAVRTISFREKDSQKPASELIFSVTNGRETRRECWSGAYSWLWGTGQFKLRACNFCDDVFAEVADMTLMDAWLLPYVLDGRGTNLAITRSPLADELVKYGISKQELSAGSCSIADAIRSQAGVLQQKRTVLAHRLWLAEREGVSLPKKRVAPRKPSRLQGLRLSAYENLRIASHQAIMRQRATGAPGLETYTVLVKEPLQPVMMWQNITHVMLRAKSASQLFKRVMKR